MFRKYRFADPAIWSFWKTKGMWRLEKGSPLPKESNDTILYFYISHPKTLDNLSAFSKRTHLLVKYYFSQTIKQRLNYILKNRKISCSKSTAKTWLFDWDFYLITLNDDRKNVKWKQELDWVKMTPTKYILGNLHLNFWYMWLVRCIY